jgi:DNA-binding NtrC family response regulator
MKPKKVLFVDDDRRALQVMSKVLEFYGYKVVTLEDPLQTSKLITKHLPDVVILDKNFPNADGIQVLREVKKEFPKLPVIMLTGYAQFMEAAEMCGDGAFAYIDKMEGIARIVDVLNEATGQDPKKPVGARDSDHQESHGLPSRAKARFTDEEKAKIKKVVNESGGNISRAADSLGITRQSLYRKIKKYEI